MRIHTILAASAAAAVWTAWTAPAADARGGSMACHSDSIPFTSPQFNLTLMLPRFDPSDAFGNGTNIPANLTSVLFVLNGEVIGNVALSNLTELPLQVTGSLNRPSRCFGPIQQRFCLWR